MYNRLPTTAASGAQKKFKSSYNAIVVGRLRKVGAIVTREDEHRKVRDGLASLAFALEENYDVVWRRREERSWKFRRERCCGCDRAVLDVSRPRMLKLIAWRH
jgi:hypothetical protein